MITNRRVPARANEISHPTAVLIIALVATVWGFGLPTTRIVLGGGLSVGALMGTQFTFANSWLPYAW